MLTCTPTCAGVFAHARDCGGGESGSILSPRGIDVYVLGIGVSSRDIYTCIARISILIDVHTHARVCLLVREVVVSVNLAAFSIRDE